MFFINFLNILNIKWKFIEYILIYVNFYDIIIYYFIFIYKYFILVLLFHQNLNYSEHSLSNSLLNSPALYMYLSFILIGAIFLLTKSKDIFMVYMPNMLNIIIIFLSTPTQDVRYLYPDFLMFYLLVIILMSILIKANDWSISI